jgi:hypothetical protein
MSARPAIAARELGVRDEDECMGRLRIIMMNFKRNERG